MDDYKPVPYPYRDIFKTYDEYLDAKTEYSKPEYWMDDEEKEEEDGKE